MVPELPKWAVALYIIILSLLAHGIWIGIFKLCEIVF